MSTVNPVPITPPPGVVLTESQRVVEGRWIAPFNNARFVRGMPQKLGGNIKITTTAASGTIRSMHAWRDLAANQYIAAGTYRKLYVYDQIFAQNDITPFRSTGTLANNPFTTTSGSAIITVSHTSHGLNAGDQVIFSGSTAVGGITPNGTFVVNAPVTGANSYTFNFTSSASSAATGGGAAVAFSYEISIGSELGTTGLGWGVGGWGLGTWGSARSNSTIVFEARIWSLDHFGKFLIASYNGGSIYTFDPSLAQPWGRAAIIAAAPTDCRAVFVTPEQFVFALRESMIVAACSQGDYTTWTPASSNTAFTRTLTEGTKLVGGKVLAPFVSLVWSDAALFVFQYTGSQFVYNASMVGKDCGLIGPNAAVTVNGVAYWMGYDNFLMFNGSVQPMPQSEDVRAFVFDTLNKQYGYQCQAIYNPRFAEIVFLYTPTGQINPTAAVVYSIPGQCWWPWTTTRVSGTHFTQGDTRPYLAESSDGFIYLHEVGNDNNGAALDSKMTLGPYALHEGLEQMDIEGILFDTFHQVGNITITLNGFDRLTDATTMDTESEIIVDTNAGLTDIRMTGRYIGMTVDSNVVGGYYRWGHPAAMVRQQGHRR